MDYTTERSGVHRYAMEINPRTSSGPPRRWEECSGRMAERIEDFSPSSRSRRSGPDRRDERPPIEEQVEGIGD